jgi:hypothetical protein
MSCSAELGVDCARRFATTDRRDSKKDFEAGVAVGMAVLLRNVSRVFSET